MKQSSDNIQQEMDNTISIQPEMDKTTSKHISIISPPTSFTESCIRYIISCTSSITWSRMKQLGYQHFLPLGLITMILIGIIFPTPGTWVANIPLSIPNIAVAMMLFVWGLGLQTDEMKAAIRSWRYWLPGIISILFITPFVAPLARAIPWTHSEFGIGFGVFCCMPTTVSTGLMVIKEGHGNVSLALLLSVITNIACIVTLPIYIPWLVVNDVNGLNPWTLLLDLFLTILVPLVIGKLIRDRSEWVRDMMKKNVKRVKIFNACCFIIIPWMQVSKNADELASLSTSILLLILASGVLLHSMYLIPHALFFYWLVPVEADRKAMMIMCSQKTLAIGVSIVISLPDEVGIKGLILVPMICSHFMQIIMDAIIATRWASQYEKSKLLETINHVDEMEIVSVPLPPTDVSPIHATPTPSLPLISDTPFLTSSETHIDIEPSSDVSSSSSTTPLPPLQSQPSLSTIPF